MSTSRRTPPATLAQARAAAVSLGQLEQAIDAARALNDTDLRSLYDFILPRLKAASAAKTTAAAARFRPGDKAQFFTAKRMGVVVILIDKVNTKSISGREVLPDGRLGTPWRVSPQLLQEVAL